MCVVAAPAHGGVLDWLSSVPFGGAVGGVGVANVREGEVQASIDYSATVSPIDPANPPMPAVDGSVLSDTFRSSPLRRGLFVLNDVKNGSEIMRVPFEAMFNYSTPYSPSVYEPHATQTGDGRSGINGAQPHCDSSVSSISTLAFLSQARTVLCSFHVLFCLIG